MHREHLASRLGFILLSAGCAIGIGNVWKFPWMTGQYGGGAFVVIYLIFLLILGTYTPICLITVGGTFGLTIFGINLACGIVGIVLNAVSLKRWKKVSLVLYIVMGWLGILALPTIWRNMTLEGLCLLLLGGVAYTVGVIFYRQKEKPYRHGIWHFFVLAGTVLQFFAVYTNCCAG